MSACAPPRRRSRTLNVNIGRLADKLALAPEGAVVAFGGGTDSAAMLVEIVRLGLPLREVLFADTGGELKRTYDFVRAMSEWLQAHGAPTVTTVRNTPTRGPNAGVTQTLYESLWRNSALPPVAFHMHTCSERFKIAPQDRYLAGQGWCKGAWAQGRKVLKLVGFEVDEAYRVNRTHPAIVANGKYDAHYPLIEWGWTREKCADVIAAAGLPDPGKSACFFCPMRKPAEIADLAREQPELLERALELEARAMASGKITDQTMKGLGGRKYAWRDLVGTMARAE